MSVVVSVEASRPEVMEFLTVTLPAILSGDIPDQYGLMNALLARAVYLALEDIRADYLVKSSGGVGKNGVVWDGHAPATIKKRSRKEGLFSGQSGRAAEGRQRRHEQSVRLQETREEIYRREYAKLRAGGVPAKIASKQASDLARFMTKKMAEYQEKLGRGQEGVKGEEGSFPILIDDSRLLQSASPGQLSGSGLSTTYTPTQEQSVEYQGRSATVYSNVPYADVHVTGNSKTGMPPRDFTVNDVPAEWADRWAAAIGKAFGEILPEIVKRYFG